MKKLLPAIALAAIALSPTSFSAVAHADTHMMEKKIEAATTTAVAFHADWCGGCKILGPKMKEVMNNLDTETKAKISMVKFDLTDETTKAASKDHAMKKGVSDLFPTGEGKPPTGVVKLIDNKTGTVLAKIHYKMSVEEITGLIKGVTKRA